MIKPRVIHYRNWPNPFKLVGFLVVVQLIHRQARTKISCTQQFENSQIEGFVLPRVNIRVISNIILLTHLAGEPPAVERVDG